MCSIFDTGERQTVLFSATKDPRTNALSALALKNNPVEVDVNSDKKEATADGLEQGKVGNCYHYYCYYFYPYFENNNRYNRCKARTQQFVV